FDDRLDPAHGQGPAGETSPVGGSTHEAGGHSTGIAPGVESRQTHTWQSRDALSVRVGLADISAVELEMDDLARHRGAVAGSKGGREESIATVVAAAGDLAQSGHQLIDRRRAPSDAALVTAITRELGGDP